MLAEPVRVPGGPRSVRNTFFGGHTVFRFLLVSLTSSVMLLAAAPEPHPLHHPLVFEPNRGQAPPPVKWIARGSGYQVFLTPEGLTMLVPAQVPGQSRSLPGIRPRPAKYNAIRMEFTGSRSWTRITGLEPTGGISNYYSGD